MNTLIIIGSAAGAITAIVSVLIPAFRLGRKIARYFETHAEDMKTLKRHDRDQYLNILRLTIVSEEMPLTERIAAGDKYIAEGGNGAVKQLYEQLKAKNPMGGDPHEAGFIRSIFRRRTKRRKEG